MIIKGHSEVLMQKYDQAQATSQFWSCFLGVLIDIDILQIYMTSKNSVFFCFILDPNTHKGRFDPSGDACPPLQAALCDELQIKQLNNSLISINQRVTEWFGYAAVI